MVKIAWRKEEEEGGRGRERKRKREEEEERGRGREREGRRGRVGYSHPSEIFAPFSPSFIPSCQVVRREETKKLRPHALRLAARSLVLLLLHPRHISHLHVLFLQASLRALLLTVTSVRLLPPLALPLKSWAPPSPRAPPPPRRTRRGC